MEYEAVVYGPVKSRRLGQSLGINLTPLELKVCNFSCGYCRVGVPSKGDASPEDFEKLSWTPERVCDAITLGLRRHSIDQTPIDYVTIAGNGEPTLYPWFAEVVGHLLEEKAKFLPDKPTAIFTNATRIVQPDIHDAIYRLDRRFFKLDAGDAQTFKRINIPIGVTYTQVIDNLLSADNFELSIAVLNGEVSNYNSFFNSEFIDLLKKVKFTKIFLYDIDIPKTVSPRFNRKIEKEKLEDLARFLTDQTERETIVLWEPTTRECNIPLYPQQIN